MKYRHKNQPTFEAFQFMGPDSYYDALEFLGREKADKTDPESYVMVETGGGQRVRCGYGMWIVKLAPGGVFMVYTDELFHTNYEAIEH